MNSIDAMQPTAHELPDMHRKIKRAVKLVTGMTLDSIEWNPNYIGLFVHVYYGGHEMVFMLSYNHLLAHDYRHRKLTQWIAGRLKVMADKQLYLRGAKTITMFRNQERKYRIRRKAARS